MVQGKTEGKYLGRHQTFSLSLTFLYAVTTKLFFIMYFMFRRTQHNSLGRVGESLVRILA